MQGGVYSYEVANMNIRQLVERLMERIYLYGRAPLCLHGVVRHVCTCALHCGCRQAQTPADGKCLGFWHICGVYVRLGKQTKARSQCDRVRPKYTFFHQLRLCV